MAGAGAEGDEIGGAVHGGDDTGERVCRGRCRGGELAGVDAGGKGGGKPDSAMGGGTDLLKVDDALAAVDDFVAEKLK